MSKLRWGILSTAKIGTKQVIPAMQDGEFCEVTAIASRDGERARQAAEQLGIPHHFDSYEALLESNAVDAIIVLSVLGVPSSGSEIRQKSETGEYAGLSPWETAFVDLVAELMEATGKPIINVPDTPIRGSLFDRGKRYSPIVLSSPQAAVRALDRMEWYGAFRRRTGTLV